MAKDSSLTPDRLRKLLDYDTATGRFVWRVTRQCRRVGDCAGCVENNGYMRIRVDGQRHMAHRLAFMHVYGRCPSGQIDHIDGDRTNNRIDNLREASPSENIANTGRLRTNTSGLKGAFFKRETARWFAKIVKNGRSRHLGYFATAEEAHAAYVAEAQRLHGSFARFE